MKNELLQLQLAKQGLTQKGLADKTGLSRTTINLMAAHGRVTKSVIKLAALSLGVLPKDIGYAKNGRLLHARESKAG